MNLMFFIQFAMIMISMSLYLISAQNPAMHRAFRIAQRQLFLVIVFNMMNLCFSVGLMKSSYPFEIGLAIVSLSFLVYQAYHFNLRVRHYFRSDLLFKFRETNIQLFLIFFFVGKCFLALALSVLRMNT